MVSVAPREHQKRRIWQFAAVDKSSGTGPGPSASRRSQHAWKGAECDDSADDQSPGRSPAFIAAGTTLDTPSADAATRFHPCAELRGHRRKKSWVL